MTTTFLTTLTHIECGVSGCGILFGISPTIHAKMTDEGREVWCPNGHRIGYSTSALQKAQDALARATHQADQARAEAERQRQRVDQRDRTLVAVRGHQTRLKKRVAAGVCPCCNRTFQNLARHMHGQHPTFADSPSRAQRGQP